MYQRKRNLQHFVFRRWRICIFFACLIFAHFWNFSLNGFGLHPWTGSVKYKTLVAIKISSSWRLMLIFHNNTKGPHILCHLLNAKLKIKSLPSHFVLVPLHVIFAWQNLSDEPFNKNPSSQLDTILFGYVVKLPMYEPLRSKGSGPQSTAKR